MWQRKIWLLSSLVLLQAAVCAASASAAEPLRWKLSPGDRLRVVTEQTVVTDTTYTGVAVQSTLTLLVESDWEVKSASEGKFEIAQKVARARVEMQSPKTDPVLYDSQDEKRPTGAARQLYNAIQPLIGLTAQVTMSDRGEIVAVELPTPAQDSAEAADKDKKPSGGNAAPTVPAETLKSLLGKPLVVLPADAVETGATWQASDVGEATVGPVTIEKTYKLAALEEVDGHEQATIAGSGQIALKSTGGLKLTDSSYAQTVLFDATEGAVTSSEQKVRLRTEKPYRETTIVVDTTLTQKTTAQKIAASNAAEPEAK